LKEAFAKVERSHGNLETAECESDGWPWTLTLWPTGQSHIPASSCTRQPRDNQVWSLGQARVQRLERHNNSREANMVDKPDQILVGRGEAKAFVAALLEASGVSERNADTVAEGLVQADLRGVESHGINRIPSYLARIRNGVLDPRAEPALKQVTPVVAQVSRETASCHAKNNSHNCTFFRSTATTGSGSPPPTSPWKRPSPWPRPLALAWSASSTATTLACRPGSSARPSTRA